MNIKVGGKKVFFSEAILCPENESIEIFIDAFEGNADWNIKVLFSENNDSEKKPNISTKLEGDLWILDFNNWKGASGTTLPTPWEFAATDDHKPIYMLAEVSKISSIYHVHLQLMVDI